MKDWENMRDFAIKLILHSLQHRLEIAEVEDKIVNERVIILHLDHATELLMKAFLIKEGYFIQQLDNVKIKKGINKITKIKDLLNEKKTIEYVDCLEIISREINFDSNEKDKIKRFHYLRNEIQHRALDIPLDKGEKIEEFAPVLYNLYKKMFPDNVNIIEGMLIEPQEEELFE